MGFQTLRDEQGANQAAILPVDSFHLARKVRMSHQTGDSPAYRLLGSARHATHFSAQHLNEGMHVQ
jgi:hypothetical protein